MFPIGVIDERQSVGKGGEVARLRDVLIHDGGDARNPCDQALLLVKGRLDLKNVIQMVQVPLSGCLGIGFFEEAE